MTASATWPVQKALAAAIQGDSVLAGGPAPMLNAAKPVHSGKPPRGALLDHVVLNDGSEDPWPHMNGQSGNDGIEQFVIWTADTSRKKGLQVYGELRRLLDGTALTLDGHTMVRGRLSLFTTYVDDTMEPAARATVVNYTVLSKVGT